MMTNDEFRQYSEIVRQNKVRELREEVLSNGYKYSEELYNIFREIRGYEIHANIDDDNSFAMFKLYGGIMNGIKKRDVVDKLMKEIIRKNVVTDKAIAMYDKLKKTPDNEIRGSYKYILKKLGTTLTIVNDDGKETFFNSKHTHQTTYDYLKSKNVLTDIELQELFGKTYVKGPGVFHMKNFINGSYTIETRTSSKFYDSFNDTYAVKSCYRKLMNNEIIEKLGDESGVEIIKKTFVKDGID